MAPPNKNNNVAADAGKRKGRTDPEIKHDFSASAKAADMTTTTTTATRAVRGLEYHRPRRPNTDTISYLKSLPLDLTVAQQEIDAFLASRTTGSAAAATGDTASTTVEFPQTLAAAFSALDEIQHEIASLAGDEVCAELLEQLIYLTVPHSACAAQLWMQGVLGYVMHLATHRYGSHVVQTLLSTLLRIPGNNPTKVDDLSLHPDAPPLNIPATEHSSSSSGSAAALADLILVFENELAPFASELAVHMCGSHVLRTLLCLLGGVELRQSAAAAGGHDAGMRRGKFKSPMDKKKKKKKRKMGDDTAGGGSKNNEASAAARMFLVSNPYLQCRDHPAMHKALENLTAALTGDSDDPQPPGALQELACHSSGGPLLSVLLRVWTYRDDAANAKTKATGYYNWQSKQEQWETRALLDHHLGTMRPEPRFALGSPAHAMAQRLLCWQSDNKDNNIKNKSDMKTKKEKEDSKKKDPDIPEEAATPESWAAECIFGLAGEARGSHVLETILQLAPDDWYAQVLRVGQLLDATTMQDYAQHTVSKFVVQTVLATARNASQVKPVVEGLEPLLSNGYLLDPQHQARSVVWRMVEAAAQYKVGQEMVLKSMVTGFATLQQQQNLPAVSKQQDCVPLLLNARKPERVGDRLMLDVMGARCIYYLLRFHPPKRCQHILTGIVENLSADVLELLIQDGLGSRCILDGILDGPLEEKASPFGNAAKQLSTKLAGRWVTLASHRIGHHVVNKLCRALSSNISLNKAQEALVQELARGKKRLSGSSMGRNVIETCMLEEYDIDDEKVKSFKEWQRLFQKKREKQKWLDDIVMGGDDDDAANDKQEQDDDEEDEDKPSSGRKKNKKQKRAMGVDAIMNAIQIPGKKKR